MAKCCKMMKNMGCDEMDMAKCCKMMKKMMGGGRSRSASCDRTEECKMDNKCPTKTDCKMTTTEGCPMKAGCKMTTTTDGCPMKQCTVDDENMFAEAKKKCEDKK